MPPRKEKPIFKDLTIATAGALHVGRSDQWKDMTKIAQWVTLREGRFSTQFDDSVTHLICSDEAFKAREPRVRAALKRGRKTVKLVTVDWLEDSINKKQKLSEKDFEIDRVLREKEKREAREKAKEKKMREGMEMAVKSVNPNFYHVFQDATFQFRYEVTITRMDEEKEQRYELRIYESNARPHLYWFVAKFFKRKGDSQPNYYRPSEFPRLFDREFGEFKAFFESKTGIPWEKRLLLCAAAQPNTVVNADAPASTSNAEAEKGLAHLEMTSTWHKLEEDGRRFVYELPTGGKPLG